MVLNNNFGRDFDDFVKQAIGFDNLFNFASEAKPLDISYPPHNIIKIGEDTYILEFALAGFDKKELNVELKDNHLKIECSCDYLKKKNIQSRYSLDYPVKVLHKGIAHRTFQRNFVLADSLHVEDVTFKNGLLSVELKQIIPEEQKPKQIQIK